MERSAWWSADRPGPIRERAWVTILSGEMLDQTALLGVLKTLYDLHLLILTVESLPELGTVPSAGRLILGFMGR